MKGRILAFMMALLIVLGGCSKKNDSSADSVVSDTNMEKTEMTNNTDSSALTDGVYVTKAAGYEGDVEVETTVNNGKITSIKVLSNNETIEIGQAAMDSIITEILDKQSLSIAAVSGATSSSNALLQAVELAVIEAKGRPEDFKKASNDVAQDIEKTADVVVVGGGGAGLSAAISAAENGASVILIEKSGLLGGNTVRAGGPFNAVDYERQKKLEPAGESAMQSVYQLLDTEPKSDLHKKWLDELKNDLADYEKGKKDFLFDSLALHILQTYNGGDYEGKLEFIEKLASSAPETLKWLEGNGVVWKDDISTVPGGLWPRAHTPINSAGSDYIKANSQRAKDLGVEIILNCEGKELITDNKRVIGVNAKMSDGSNVKLNSNKAVILATGGFAANKEMRQKYDPSLIESLGTTNSPAITGDGIMMAEKVNANLTGMEYIQCLPLGNPKTGSLNGWLGGIGVEYYYQINKSGERFMAEDGRRDTMTQALLAQESAMSYVITDTNRESENTEKNLWGDNIEKLVEEKSVYRADTIEELAEQIGVNPEKLKETHEKFNSYVEKGMDDDFGRKLFGDKIDKPPFYASPRTPTVHHTMGGIEIDLNTRVLDKNGAVIEGLFAAGEVTGGIHGKNRLGGNALVDIHVFGRLAGANAAK